MTKRAAILIICRVFNQAVLLLSPVLLVRIFDMSAYGQYREFIVYAIMLGSFIEFTMNTNLIYFLPKHPNRERQSVTHTVLLMLGTSVVGLTVIYLFRGPIFSHAHYDFVRPLIVYIFFSLNFDFFENYWLGKKRTDYVLLYSSGRIALRTSALIVSAYLTRSVMGVIYTLIGIEMAKGLFVIAMLGRVLTRRLDRELLKEQLRFILPLGTAVTINQVNNQLANLMISIRMGVERLAVYANGSYQIPILNVVQSSVMDTLFPEMAQIEDAPRLRLWQRANVVFCFVVFPVYVVFLYFAPTVIVTLFKKEYAASIPLFRIYLTLMLINCFDMGSPLRSINQNKYFILGSALSFGTNIGLILLLFTPVGFLLPAFAFLSGELAKAIYLATRIMHFYRIRARGLFLWSKLLRVACAALLSIPALAISRWVDMNPVGKAVCFSLLYLAVYYFAMRRFKIDEVELLVQKVFGRLRRSSPARNG
jgi:O-antigen/teichoic acid export membrane protein